jgi:uncharacterized small protein (DUF1192 family)
MAISDDDRPKKQLAAQPGENLYYLSVEELRERISLYQVEIDRLTREIEAKEKSRQAADTFFRR